MLLELFRYSSNKESTGGLLMIDGKFHCYTVEDQQQRVKVPGETRIPAGIYTIKLRDAGGMNKRYKRRFSGHVGMLHLQNVPGFEWIYIHPGNNDDNTEGCILTGYGTKFDGEITTQDSTSAYLDLYQRVRDELIRGNTVKIIIKEVV